MKNMNRRILSLFLCFTLLLGIVVPNYVNAEETITIDVKEQPKLDIVLTVENSKLDLTNFKDDILMALIQKGFNEDNINITSIETIAEEFSQNSYSAQEIYDTWTMMPNPNVTVVLDGMIINDFNQTVDTGNGSGYNQVFIYEGTIGTQHIEFEADIINHGCCAPSGFVLNYNKNTDVAYCLLVGDLYDSATLSSYPYSDDTILVKVSNFSTYNKRITDYSHFLPYSTAAKNTLIKSISTRSYIPTTTTYNKIGAYWYKGRENQFYNLKVVMDKDGVLNAYLNDSLLFSYAFPESDFDGTYGAIGYMFQCMGAAKNTSIATKQEVVKEYTDIMYDFEWNENTDRYIVNVDNEINKAFSEKTKVGEILTRTINDDIDFIQWGSDENQSAMESFIAQNNDNGTFIDGNEYENALNETVEYIVSQYDIDDENENQYVVVNAPTDLEVSPSNLATNTSDEEYPNGKWIIHHNAKYFANSTGQSEYSEQYQDDLSIVFDKPGEYTIYYGEDLVKTIYAHRKPIANFSMSLNSDKTLNLINTSYDLDSNVDTYGLGNGIVDVSWKWKKLSDETWTNGQPTFALETGESYVVQLSVVDEQGAESTHTSKYITLEENAKIPPIAAFNYANSTIFTNNELEIIDSSYDPAGNNLTSYSWTLKKDGKEISTTSEPILNFNSSELGVGNYSYSLIVTNNLGLTSEAFTRYFNVIEDTIPPSVTIDPTYSDWGDSSAINFEFMDSGSGFAKFRYTHSATQTPPSDNDTSWSEWSNSDNGSLTIDEDGVWYLHLQAQDNNGNMLNRTVGVYRIDTTNPVIESVEIDETSVERVIPIMVNANDTTSGLAKQPYRFVNITTGEDSGYIDNNVYNATTNGVFTIYVKDKNENIATFETREITKVDRVAPEILTFSTSTDQWTKSVDTQISAKDTFSGMNTYSYALEKLTHTNDSKTNKNIDVSDLLSKDIYAQDLNDVTLIPIDVDDLDLNTLSWQEDDTFTITENGTYNLYARDMADNVSAVQFTIDNVDITPPSIEKIEYSTQDVTNQDVIITIVGAKDENVGLHEIPYSYDNGITWVKENTFSVKGNGEFNVLVRDQLENFATFSYKVENIDKILPSLEDINIANNREEKVSTISIQLMDDRELYGYVIKNNSTLPSDDEYNTSFIIDENNMVNEEIKITQNDIYYLFVKDKGGNVFCQKIIIDALVTGIDVTQNQITEYEELGANDTDLISLFNNNNSPEGEYDTHVYVSQKSTFSVVIPKTIILDGKNGNGSYETSVVGNIAGVETICVLPSNTFLLNDVANVKSSINANITQEQTSFAHSEIANKTTTKGNVNAPNITAGSWKGTFSFNIFVQNNQYVVDSIASVTNDSFGLALD